MVLIMLVITRRSRQIIHVSENCDPSGGEYKTFQSHLVLDQQLNFIKRFNQMFLSHVIPEKSQLKSRQALGM